MNSDRQRQEKCVRGAGGKAEAAAASVCEEQDQPMRPEPVRTPERKTGQVTGDLMSCHQEKLGPPWKT